MRDTTLKKRDRPGSISSNGTVRADDGGRRMSENWVLHGRLWGRAAARRVVHRTARPGASRKMMRFFWQEPETNPVTGSARR